MTPQLKIIGLTGGIGSGKSTVAAMLRAHGLPVLDADQLARAVVAPGQPAHAEIAALWPGVLSDDGAVDRKKLGALVFADPIARARLEAITHPRIQEASRQEAAALGRAGHPVVIYEAALLVETGRHRELDGLIVVVADPAHQVSRVMARDGATREQAERRLAAQLPLEDKRRVATYVVDNNGDRASTRAQVDALVKSLTSTP